MSITGHGIELNRPYKLALAPRLGKRQTGQDDELVTFEYSFKPPVDTKKRGRVHVEKAGNKWSLEEAAPAAGAAAAAAAAREEEEEEPVRFEGAGRRPRNEHLMVWNASAEGGSFVITKVDTIVSLSHVRDNASGPIRPRLGSSTSAKNLLKVSKRKPAILRLPSKGGGVADATKAPRQNSTKRQPSILVCSVCQAGEDKDELLQCDTPGCETVEHTYCTFPPLSVAPVGRSWYCSQCVEENEGRK